MGLVSSRSADTTAAQLAALETQTQPVQPHPVLGFPVQIHADLVHDISRRDSQGNPKWKLLRPNSQTLVLNENYSFESEDEQLLLKLWFLYSTLQSRDKMRDFFYFSTAEQRQRQPQPEEQRRVLSTGFRSFRDVYDRWNRTLERTCGAGNSVSGSDLGDLGLEQWLQQRGFSGERSRGWGSSGHELCAKTCAFKTGRLDMTPQVQSWLKTVQLDSSATTSDAIRLFVASQVQQPADGPYAKLRLELLRQANSAYEQISVRKLLLCPDQLNALSNLTRSKILPRRVLWDLLTNAGVRNLSAKTTATRLLDRVFREIVCPDLEPRLLAALAGPGSPGSRSQFDILVFEPGLRKMILKQRFLDTLLFSREFYIESGFREEPCCEEYVDKLLEYGCLWLLYEPSLAAKFSEQDIAAVAKEAGCLTREQLVSRLQACLSREYLISWLLDRLPGRPSRDVESMTLAELTAEYRRISLGCLLGTSCPDPEFPGFEEKKSEPGPGPEQPQLVPEPTEDEKFERALRLHTMQIDYSSPQGMARLRRVLDLLKLDSKCGAEQQQCSNEQLGDKVINKINEILVASEAKQKILDRVLVQEGATVRPEATREEKLEILSKINANKIRILDDAATVRELLRLSGQDDKLVWNKLKELKLVDELKEQQDVKAELARLVEDYTDRALLLQLAKQTLERDIQPTESVYSVLFGTS